jgi:hypothetical protein
MAFRPARFVIEGTLGSTQLGRFTRWMQFVSNKKKVTPSFEWDFHRDTVENLAISIRGGDEI